MLTDRIMGAIMFRQGVYEEVKGDTSFNQNAWLIVAVAAFLSQLGANAVRLRSGGIVAWLVATIVLTVFAIGAFALACFVVVQVGKMLFQATATFDEMVRVLGLAYVWNIVGVLGVLGAISLALGCIASPISIAAALLGLAAYAIALKAALGLEWVQTIITAVCAWVVIIIVMAIPAGILTAILGPATY